MRSKKELSQERFGRYAASYVKSPTHAGGPVLDRLVGLVGGQRAWDALDIATGAGRTALSVARLDHPVREASRPRKMGRRPGRLAG
jgi:hypothetical protein